MNKNLSRRAFVTSASALGLVGVSGLALPYYSRANTRPAFTHGVQSGDVDTVSGMVWTRVDRPSRVMFEVSTTESFSNAVKLPPLDAVPESDFAVKRLLTDLASDQDIFYRMTAVDLSDVNAVSEPIVGRFKTAPASKRNIRFTWSGDTAGQGWGIDDKGMYTYATMARHTPDFFLHSGDTIYADGPIQDEVELKDGTKWINKVLTDEKRKVAETLAEYRGQWKYNMMDEHCRAMNAVCPTFFQWDDHEVVNNWSGSKDLSKDDRYTEKSVALLTSRAARAFHEMTPIRFTPAEPGRVYRKIAYGPLLDVFFLDLRSYRGPNGDAVETEMTPQSRIIGEEQVKWLKRELANSKATWKVIASDMPLGIIVWNDATNKKGAEAIANGAAGRGERPRAGDRRPAALHQECRHRQYGLADRGRPLHRRALLQSRESGLPGLQSVLGVRLRAAACRNLRTRRSRHDVRPRAEICEGADRRAGPEPASFGRTAVLRPRRH